MLSELPDVDSVAACYGKAHYSESTSGMRFSPHLPKSSETYVLKAVSVEPSASSLVIKALKEPPRDRKK